MPKPKIFLSKSKYLDGLKCPKLLWVEFNNRDVIPEPDEGAQAIFDQGTRVGELAQQLYPNGIKIEREQMPERTHVKSIEALKLRKPLFEAGLIYNKSYALPDILVPVEGGAWDIVEVKSGTQVKEEHYIDVAYQKYVYRGAGLKIRRCYLMHIDNEYFRKGEIKPEKLFKQEDISKDIMQYMPGIESSIDSMLATISGKEPKVKIGSQCGSPYGCPLEEICWSFLPEKNIFQLWSGRGKKLFPLLDQGILKITDIPKDELSDKQLLQVQSHKTRKPYIDRTQIGEFLKELKYPMYFLDFETIGLAIPAYELTYPYSNIPFQYSLHIVQKEGAKPEHHSYLAPGDVDPRPAILLRLKKLLGTSGSIVAYNMSFEINCLKYAIEAYPEHKKWFENVQGRFVDLMVPFRSFYYYHPDQEGSYSIKYVLPAMTKTSYKGMEIADGGTASREYQRVTFGSNIEDSDRQKVRDNLEKYCQLDTQAMIDVLEALKALKDVVK